MIATLEVQRADLPALQIVNRPLSVQNLVVVVDADVADQQDLAGFRVVFRVVAINIRALKVDLHVVLGYRHAVDEARLAVGPDFHRHIGEAAELGAHRKAKH